MIPFATLTEGQAVQLSVAVTAGVLLLVAAMIIAFARWSARDRRKREADIRRAQEHERQNKA